MSNVASPRYLKVNESAAMMRVPTSTVYELIRRGKIPGVMYIGRNIRIDREKLEHWLKAGGEQKQR